MTMDEVTAETVNESILKAICKIKHKYHKERDLVLIARIWTYYIKKTKKVLSNKKDKEGLEQ